MPIVVLCTKVTKASKEDVTLESTVICVADDSIMR
jgi:hypothetical protein